MGWYSVPECKNNNDIVQYLTKDNADYNDHFSFRVLAYTVKHHPGEDILWMVQEFKDKRTGDITKVIGCYLIYNGGYKPMDETFGPHYYDCPIHYLKMVPCPDSKFAREWREQVVVGNKSSVGS